MADADNEEMIPPVEPSELTRDELIKMIDEEGRSYPRRIADMFKGLRQPKDSLDYKKAMIELQRLGAPLGAILLFTIILIVMSVMRITAEEKPPVIVTEIVEATEAEELEEVEEEPPPPPEEIPELTEEMEVSLIEDEDIRDQTPTIGYYASFSYLNGFRKAIYWTRSKMEKHALRYSKGYAAKKGYTFWEKEFDQMAFKTMLRQLISKWGVMTTDMQRAYESDADIVQDDEGNNFFGDEEQIQEAPEATIPTDAQMTDDTPAEPGASEHQIGFNDL